MTERNALKMALEALERPSWSHASALANINQAITAIKEVLAQPEQEQPGFFSREAMRAHSDFHVAQPERKPDPCIDGSCDCCWKHLDEPEQEPVAWANPHDLQNFDMKVRTSGDPLHTVPLYTTPPQRTWVGLTDEEKAEIQSLKWWDWEDAFDLDGYTRAIEAKLKEKNT